MSKKKKGKSQQPTAQEHNQGYQDGGAQPYIPENKQHHVKPNHLKEFAKVATPLLKLLK